MAKVLATKPVLVTDSRGHTIDYPREQFHYDYLINHQGRWVKLCSGVTGELIALRKKGVRTMHVAGIYTGAERYAIVNHATGELVESATFARPDHVTTTGDLSQFT